MKVNKPYISLCFALSFLVSACGGNLQEEPVENKIIEKPVVKLVIVPDNRDNDEYQILMIGNSHTSSVSKALAIIMSHGTEKDVNISTLFGSHLDKTINKEGSIETFEASQWSHVILQGQKYSQSQSTLYPTQAVKFWINKSTKQGATPILFPEHPQQGDKTEAAYVHNIHVSISNERAACVGPVGLAWDLALSAQPSLGLYSEDGNHSSSLGAFLSALVFYEIITGKSADLLSYSEVLPGSELEQGLLKQMATQAIAENPSCTY